MLSGGGLQCKSHWCSRLLQQVSCDSVNSFLLAKCCNKLVATSSVLMSNIIFCISCAIFSRILSVIWTHVISSSKSELTLAAWLGRNILRVLLLLHRISQYRRYRVRDWERDIHRVQYPFECWGTGNGLYSGLTPLGGRGKCDGDKTGERGVSDEWNYRAATGYQTDACMYQTEACTHPTAARSYPQTAARQRATCWRMLRWIHLWISRGVVIRVFHKKRGVISGEV